MMYQGGKTRRAKAIAHIINSVPGEVYIEPFLGSAAVMAEINKAHRYGSDLHEDIVLMWKALNDGWTPPEKYRKANTTN